MRHLDMRHRDHEQPPTARAARWAGPLVAVLVCVTAGLATAQTPGPAPTAKDGSADRSLASPGMQRFNIRRDTPAERDAFLQRRQEGQQESQQASQGATAPVEVPPLPAQAITPPALPLR